MSAASLVLARHSNPFARPDLSTHNWILNLAGIRNATKLASELAEYFPFRLASSPEPKAMQTAQVVAEGLQIETYSLHEALGEQKRATSPWFSDMETRRAAIHTLFAAPDDVVFGEESARDAYQRFKATLDTLRNAAPDTSLVVITHGTVMSLFTAYENNLDPASIWDNLGIPCYIVLDLKTYRLLRIVNRLE